MSDYYKFHIIGSEKWIKVFDLNLLLILSWLCLTICACVPTKKSTPPNILIAISDDQSYPHASAYVCEFVNTPNFDRVAQQGVLFINAYTPSPSCSPTRASILIGKNIWEIEEAVDHPNFRLLAYIYHMLMDVEAPESIEKYGHLIHHTHIAEKEGRAAPGTHSEDFTDYFTAFKNIG